MYIGHYAAAAALLSAAPGTPVFPIAVAVAYPDLLWPLLVYLGKEKVKVSKLDPLQKAIKFTSYPHSHSLVRSAVLDIIPSVAFGLIYHNVWVGVLFWIGALSHWLLDVIVHMHDLPVIGSKKNDKYVGFGLWGVPKVAFVAEYIFFASVIILTAPQKIWSGLLIGGLALHILNANSFFGFTKKNPTSTPRQYASLALFGFAAAITWFTLTWK